MTIPDTTPSTALGSDRGSHAGTLADAKPQLEFAYGSEDELPATGLNAPRDQQAGLIVATIGANIGDHIAARHNRRAALKSAHLESMRDVVDITALIEAVLKRDFGGRGRGIHSRLDSLEHPIPLKLDKELRYLAAVRNKALVEPWWPIPDRARYLQDCERAAAMLLDLASQRHQPHGRFADALLGKLRQGACHARRIIKRGRIRSPLLAMATLLALSAVLVLLSAADTVAQVMLPLR